VPHLWIEQAAEWYVIPLGEELELATLPGSTAHGTVVRSTGTRQDWHLVAGESSGVVVNGYDLHGGFRTLQDKDEILIPGIGALFFSTERLAVIEPLPETARDVCCPRCRQMVPPGTPAVRCPGCGVWHHGELHASTNLSCWTYAPGCAMCAHPTPMDTGYQWTPEAV
jgi:hypothetical protein